MAKNEVSEGQQAPAVPSIKPLTRSAMTFADARFVQWSVIMPRGVSKEQLTLSGLWSVIGDQLHTGDRLTVMAEDRSYYAECLVLDAGRGFANIHLLNYYHLPALLVAQEGLPPGFEIFFAGDLGNGDGGYCAKRVCDGVLMTKGHNNREACLAALLESATLR